MPDRTADTAIDTIVHFGAGRGGDLRRHLDRQPRQIVLIEAQAENVEALERVAARHHHVRVTHAAVAGEPGPHTLFRLSLPELSSVRRPTALLDLYPGIEVLEERLVETIIPADSLTPLRLNPEHQNLLVIDVPGEELPILKSLDEAKHLVNFTLVEVRCGCRPLYADATPAEEVFDWLTKRGYKSLSSGQEEDPDFPVRLLKKNLNKKTTKETDDEDKEPRTRSDRSRGSEEKDRELFEHLLTDLELRLKNEIRNSVKQLEAHSNLLAFMNGWFPVPSMHGWPISPDIALHLINLIQRNEYDLIIEFGSGSLTAIIARSLLYLEERLGSTGKVCEQISFEHIEDYRDATLNTLRQSGINEASIVALTPLCPYTAPDGNTYSYYDCSSLLSEMLRLSGARTNNVLAVVDGPPGVTGKHARYPALPILLSKLRGVTIDILLDDYDRQDEKEIVEKWKHEIDENGLRFSSEEIVSEKGALLLRVWT